RGSGFGIVKDAVSLGDRLELRFRRLVAGMAVRMVPGRQLSKGAADVLCGGIPGHPELGIVIAFGHALPGFQAFELKPKDAVLESGSQQFRRAGKGDVADQNTPLDLPVNRGTSRNGPLGTNDDPAALEGDIDLGLQDARKGHLQQEIVSLFKKIKDEIE